MDERTLHHAEGSSDVYVVARDSGRRIRQGLPDPPSITLPVSDAFPATVDVFGTASRVKRFYDDAIQTAIYLVGHAALSKPLDDIALLRWCAASATGPHPQSLRGLHGAYVLIFDNRATQEVTFVSDCLGLRQWFVGQFNDRLVAGTNVRQLLAAGLSGRRVNYDAVACWLRFNHPCASQSVLDDYHGIEPATVRVHRPDGSCVRSTEWGRPEYGVKTAALDDVVDESFAAAEEAQRALTRGMSDLHVPVSGGYDSRLLLALASRQGQVRLQTVTVDTHDEDVAIAIEVARVLGHACEVISARHHVIDLFDDPFAFTPGGFLTGRNLTSAIARRRPGMPILNGFIGDDLVRGSTPAPRNGFYLMDAQTHSLDELTRVTEFRFAYEHHRMHLFQDAVRRRAKQRVRDELRIILRRGLDTGRPTTHATMYCHERLYFANIILQHLDVAEGIAPLCNFAMLNCRFRHHPACFDEQNYPNLFRRHFPALSHFPTSDAAPVARGPRGATRHLRRWSAQIARALISSDYLLGLNRRRIATMLPHGLLGMTTYEKQLAFVYKLLKFERSLKQYDIAFDWRAI